MWHIGKSILRGLQTATFHPMICLDFILYIHLSLVVMICLLLKLLVQLLSGVKKLICIFPYKCLEHPSVRLLIGLSHIVRFYCIGNIHYYSVSHTVEKGHLKGRNRLEPQTNLCLKNVVFWDVMPCGSYKNDVLEELSFSSIRVTRIDELGTLAVSSNRCMLQRNANCHPNEGGAKFLRNVGSYKSHIA
jgi:hypothetical protein